MTDEPALKKALHELRNSLNNVHLQLVLAEKELEPHVQATTSLRRIVGASKQLAAAVACVAALESRTPS